MIVKPPRRFRTRAGAGRLPRAIGDERRLRFSAVSLEAPSPAELALWCAEDLVAHSEHLSVLVIARCGALLRDGARIEALPLAAPVVAAPTHAVARAGV